MEVVRSIVEGFQKRLEHCRKKSGPKSTEHFYEAMIRYYQNIYLAKEECKPLAWVGAFTPIEIFYAMDIVPFIPELHCAAMASQNHLARYLDSAAEYGLPVEICSIHRAMVGMAVNETVPTPDLMVNSAHVCDSGFKSFGTLSKYYNCPEFVLDSPREGNQEGINYFAKEIRNLIEFLEDFTHQKMDFNKLERILVLSRHVYEHFYEIAEMRKEIPTPLRGRESLRSFTIYRHLAGTEGALPYFEHLKEEVGVKVKEKKGGILNERYRIYWAYVPINYYLGIYDWMEEEFGAIVVMDLFNAVYRMEAEPSDPLTYLAAKSLADLYPCTLAGPLETTLQDNINIVRDYKVDGVVYVAHIGCKQGCAMIRPLRDILRDKLGIPTLVIDADIIDPTVISIENLKNKLESFFEMLEEQKPN